MTGRELAYECQIKPPSSVTNETCAGCPFKNSECRSYKKRYKEMIQNRDFLTPADLLVLLDDYYYGGRR